MSTRRLDGEAVSHVWMKAMVTVTAMAGLVAGQFIMLPMVDFDPQVHEGARARWSIMALGLNPLMSAFLLVELAAVLVPVWQPLREGGPVGRRKLRRAALILGLILATGQAVVMVLAAETLRVASTPGWTFRLVTIMTLLGATAVLIVLVQLVDRHGLGNGFSILILASLIPESLQVFGNVWAAARSDTIGFDSLLNGAFIVAGLVAATLWMFSRYRLPIHGLSDNTSPVRLPACGIVPFTMVPAALLYLTSLAHVLTNSSLRLPLQSVGAVLQNSRSNLPILLLLSVGAAALFSWMFNQPDRVNSTWRRFPGTAIFTMAQLKAAMLESAVFIVLLVLGQHWLIGQWGGASVPSALTIAVATGIFLDLTREVRAQCIHPKLVPVWEIHQLYAVDPAMRLLAAEGIQVFPRGLHHRVLLQFFGPFVPVHLMVEEEHAQRAQDLLQTPLPS